MPVITQDNLHFTKHPLRLETVLVTLGVEATMQGQPFLQPMDVLIMSLLNLLLSDKLKPNLFNLRPLLIIDFIKVVDPITIDWLKTQSTMIKLPLTL